MGAIALATRALLTPLAKKIERAAFDPQWAQEIALAKVKATCDASEVAARLGLGGVRSLDDLKGLPPTDYESIREASDRVYREGAAAGRSFGKTRVVAMALSSGTTGAPKRIPVTRAFLAAHRRAMFALQAALLHGSSAWAHFAGGRQLLLANSPVVETAPSGIPCGYMSGIVLAAAPRIMQKRFLPSPNVLREPSWDERMRRILDEARGEDVRMIGAFPSALKSLTETALDHYGVKSLEDVWPNLRAVFFGGSPLFAPARAAIERACRKNGSIRVWENYSAIEAMFGHSYRDDWPGLVFSPFESVFLFSESADGSSMKTLSELEEGGRYHVFLTNAGALVNYAMGDVLEITSRRPLTFRVVGRAVDRVSISSERITTADAELAFAAIGAPSLDFALYLEEGRPCRVVWALPWDADAKTCAALDRALCDVNVSYARVRASGFFGDARREIVSASVFRAYRSARLHVGTFKEKKIFQTREDFAREYGL